MASEASGLTPAAAAGALSNFQAAAEKARQPPAVAVLLFCTNVNVESRCCAQRLRRSWGLLRKSDQGASGCGSRRPHARCLVTLSLTHTHTHTHTREQFMTDSCTAWLNFFPDADTASQVVRHGRAIGRRSARGRDTKMHHGGPSFHLHTARDSLSACIPLSSLVS